MEEMGQVTVLAFTFLFGKGEGFFLWRVARHALSVSRESIRHSLPRKEQKGQP